MIPLPSFAHTAPASESALTYTPLADHSDVFFERPDGQDHVIAHVPPTAGRLIVQRRIQERWGIRHATRWAPAAVEPGMPIHQSYAGRSDVEWRDNPLTCERCGDAAGVLVTDTGLLCGACALRAEAPVPYGEALGEFGSAVDLVNSGVSAPEGEALLAIGGVLRLNPGEIFARAGAVRLGWMVARRKPPICLALAPDQDARIRVYRASHPGAWLQWWGAF